jgi:hypothetical protein
MNNNLDKTLTDILAWLKQNDMTVFWGSYGNTNHRAFVWEDEGNWQEYLATAKKAGVTFVAISRGICDLDAFAGSEFTDPEHAKQLIESLRPHYQKLGWLSLSWMKEGVAYELELNTEWADDYGELVDLESEDGTESAGPPKAEVERCVRLLANDERFQNAKSYEQRDFVARKVLPREISGGSGLYHVIAQAKCMYDLEIKPQKDSSLREEVAKLREQGLSNPAIARKLKLSSKRVQDLG